MANIIKIKRSQTTATPATLAEGELAYSELSGNLFIGTAGANLEKIGGNTDVIKLAGIAAGAQVNTVDSVNGLTGAVSLSFTELDDVVLTALANGDILQWDGNSADWKNVPPGTVGVTDHDQLSNNGGAGSHVAIASHIADLSIHYTQASISITESQISDLGTYIPASEKAAINGVATLNANGVIPDSQIPPLAITTTYVVASEVEQLALTVQEGDVAVRTDLNQNFIALNATNATMADWQLLLTPTDAVLSVNGQTGIVVLAASDVGAAPTTLTLTAGIGLAGGGDLTANRTFDLDLNSLTALVEADGSTDYAVVYEAGVGHKKMLLNDILDGGQF